MEETLVFIDGAYLSLIVKRLFGGATPRFDIKRFSYGLAKEQGLWCRRIFYYTAPPYLGKSPKEADVKRKALYDSFVSKLSNERTVTVREGRCQKTSDGFRQKGVDTLLTMDLMDEPQEAGVKTVIILTCDTDFVPVLERIRSKHGVKVVLYYFADRVRDSKFSMSNHLLMACDKKVALNGGHFEECEFVV